MFTGAVTSAQFSQTGTGMFLNYVQREGRQKKREGEDGQRRGKNTVDIKLKMKKKSRLKPIWKRAPFTNHPFH